MVFGKAFAAAKTTLKLLWVERGPGNLGARTRPLLSGSDDPSWRTWYADSVSRGCGKRPMAARPGIF